ncbi:sugar-binding transcriptional regulator [Camelliibacillus cellulosilyticus]|uniref:Sugar-binding transcriptional regulator n=1 Tax=Camelliibacillus cellulosilyticus TaxID=2174486 RepID=A0ABV9GPP7_9BACL
MENLVNMQRKLVPDVLEVMIGRYRILQAIHFLGPIGRRALSGHLGLTERVLRGEVEFLGRQSLLDTASNGMMLTIEGERLLNSLEGMMKDVSGIAQLEKQLKAVLNCSRVIIVSGDSDHEPWVKNEMGLACVRVMEKTVKPDSIIAVTGGTTVAAVAEMMRPFKKSIHPLFVSARGGLGEQVENQANTICAKMAERADGHHRLLHVPDPISEESYQTLIEEPSIHEVVELIHSAGIVIHGIGDAKTMAMRRGTAEDRWQEIESKQAIAEAFGYYFNREGQIVHKVKTMGLSLQELFDGRTVIAVAGGESKGAAIEAYFKKGPKSILITDEGAAMKILEIKGQEKDPFNREEYENGNESRN